MGRLWAQLLSDFDDAQLAYCLLRDVTGLAAGNPAGLAHPASANAPRRAEVDLLVAPRDLPRLQALLAARGFVRLRRWGYAPHHFFVAYDEQSDQWLKLDVVTRFALGRPVHAYATSLGDECLATRVRLDRGWIPAPELELVTTLLHCIVDKEELSPQRRRRVQDLALQVADSERIAQLTSEYWPAEIDWTALRGRIERGAWSEILDDRQAILRKLRGRSPLGTAGRHLRDRCLRKASRLAGLFRPDAPTVALLAPDGAGKSTVAQGIAESFFFPAHLVYMGLHQNEGARAPRVEIPGVGLARRIARQWGRYLVGRAHQSRGELVLFDRYHYDALLPQSRPQGTLGRLRRWLLGHCCPHADLILMLDAPGAVLFERKREHTAEALEDQRLAYRALQSRLPHMMIVNAARDADAVRREALSCIWRGCARRAAKGA